MSNINITLDKLVVTDNIVPELHYGIYIYDCSLQPGYICEGKGQCSGIATSDSAVTTSVYQIVFNSKTKFSELLYLGLDQLETSQKLLGVSFHPLIIELEKIVIFNSSLKKLHIQIK
ncbi:10208_t:CDS:2 [Diversispora eburnea]|uniref:10208_t:CDS:1 n=1 Tax=Diversispora eburnea TaxID=1213867 RepID=A0A9N9B8S5_9GLOM|nr:10208_t:CDS:2 [Diversispora eburnea]